MTIYDPDLVTVNDLGANFYCEEGHIGKATRAEACLSKLQELNPYVKVDVISDEKTLMAAIQSGSLHIYCQTEMRLGGQFLDPAVMNDACREHNVGFISTGGLGPWGYCFVDYGNDHVVTDHDGEQTKSFIVV